MLNPYGSKPKVTKVKQCLSWAAKCLQNNSGIFNTGIFNLGRNVPTLYLLQVNLSCIGTNISYKNGGSTQKLGILKQKHLDTRCRIAK